MLAFISLSGRYIDVYYPLHYSVFLKFHNEIINMKITITLEEKWAKNINMEFLTMHREIHIKRYKYFTCDCQRLK